MQLVYVILQKIGLKIDLAWFEKIKQFLLLKNNEQKKKNLNLLILFFCRYKKLEFNNNIFENKSKTNTTYDGYCSQQRLEKSDSQ